MTGSGKQRRLASGTRTAGRGLLQVLVVVVALVSTLAVLGMPAAAAAPPAIVHVPVVSTFVGKPIDIAATTRCGSVETCPAVLVFRPTGGGTRPAGAWQRLEMLAGQVRNAPDGSVLHDWTGACQDSCVSDRSLVVDFSYR